MNKQRIWIDVTDLKDWSGHMTGIQRVIYNVAKRYAEDEAYDVHGMVFDDAHKVFGEYDFGHILEAVQANARDYTDDESTGQSQEVSLRSIEKLMRNAPRAVVRRLPASVKQRIPSEIKEGLRLNARLTIELARHAKRAVRKRMQVSAVFSPDSLVQFQKTDVVLILGKTWDIPDLIPVLGRLKQTHHFRLVHLIHDMIPILEPHLFGPGLFEPYTRCMFDVCSISDGLLAQSQSTRADIERFCDMLLIKRPSIGVIRLGDEVLKGETRKNVQAPDSRLETTEFILHVGTIEVRKNHVLLYNTYREAALRGIPLPPLVIVGARGWLTGDVIYQMEHDPLLKDAFIILDNVGDDALLWLYEHCRFTVFPSTYEGWGLPVAESLAHGKVCITSRTSSMPEIAGPLLDYISPYNTQEMLDAMMLWMDNKQLHKKEAQIVREYHPTSWSDTYREVADFVTE